MDELARKFALIYGDINHCTPQEAEISFQEKLTALATGLVDQITVKRTQMLNMCQRKRQDLAQFGRDLDMDTGKLPEICPPYEPLLSQLDKQLQEFQTILTARMKKITGYFDEATEIANAIGVKPPRMPSNYHLDEIESLKKHLLLLREDRDKRFIRLEQLLDQVLPLYQELEYEGKAMDLNHDPFENLRDDKLGLLEAEIEDLQHLRSKRLEQAESLKKEITSLGKFISENVDFTAELSTSYLNKLISTRDLFATKFQEKLAEISASALETYTAYCAHLSIEPQTFEIGTREVYEAILAENKRLDKVIQERKKIDTLHSELKKLKEDELNLDEAAKNPDRYKQRGAVLIEEGKRRNRLLIRKPRVIQQLKKLLGQWNQTHSEPIKVDGEDLSKFIAEEEARASRKPAGRAAVAAKNAVTKITSKISKGPARTAKQLPNAPATAATSPPALSTTAPRMVSMAPKSLPVRSTSGAAGKPRERQMPLREQRVPLKRTTNLQPIIRKPLVPRHATTIPGHNGLENLRRTSSILKETKRLSETRLFDSFELEDVHSSVLSLPSIGNCSTTPSKVTTREHECCDGLKSTLGRTVKIAQFNPDLSMMDANELMSPTQMVNNEVTYNEWRRRAIEQAGKEN